jgi:glyceraldehyde-3-phosphate dehydrogenase/erythrose-4-phosphate dehydrogenase
MFVSCVLSYTVQYMEYMFKYDTVHGTYNGTVSHDEHHLIVNGHKIKIENQVSCSDTIQHKSSSYNTVDTRTSSVSCSVKKTHNHRHVAVHTLIYLRVIMRVCVCSLSVHTYMHT